MSISSVLGAVLLLAVIASGVVVLPLRSPVIRAVFLRNLLSYFAGLLGYLFIVVFVAVAAFFAFRVPFFANNLANFDQLSRGFPWLLLFIVPAITMSTWADEKKMGTDELLFTLPARDTEILAGKYLAVLAVYSVALLFSATLAIALEILGAPDWGVLFTTFIGYWIAGAALLAAGMFASGLTGSTTVAFVLGAVICAIPVGIGYFPAGRDYSVAEQLYDFTNGLLSIRAVVYFGSILGLMLYLNKVLISRRHWNADRSTSMGLQYTVRAVSLAVALIGLNAVTLNADRSADLTGSQLYSLHPTTRELVSEVTSGTPITIHAFLSPEVPRDYVQVRKRLIGLLKEYRKLGGGITLRLVEVEPSSTAAEEAESFGVRSRQVQDDRGGKSFIENIFLGVVVSGPRDEVVIPFIDIGIPIEYELTRSIATAAKDEKRLKVGVLATDAKVTGGFNMQTFQRSPEWRIVAELKKQYDVEEVNADAAIDRTKYHVLLAVLPSSLTQPQMRNLVDYVTAGRPVLIFDDPLPVMIPGGLGLAPRLPKPPQGGGGGGPFGGRGRPSEPKADGGKATSLIEALKIQWDNGQVAWSLNKPHPEFNDLPPEYVFITNTGSNSESLYPHSVISSGLQEVVAFFPGSIKLRPVETQLSKALDKGAIIIKVNDTTGFPDSGILTIEIKPKPGGTGRIEYVKYGRKTKTTFAELKRGVSGSVESAWDADARVKTTHVDNIPLLQTTIDSGVHEWEDITEPGMFTGVSIKAEPSHGTRDRHGHVVATHIHNENINCIFVADIDLISDQIFLLRERGLRRTVDSASLQFDNVTFLLNAVDVLADNDQLVPLRNRRARPGTLDMVNARKLMSIQQRAELEEKAETEADGELDAAQARMDAAIKKIEDDDSLDVQSKKIQAELVSVSEQRKLDVAKENINRKKRESLSRIKRTTDREITAIESGFRLGAILLSPLPAILLGIVFLCYRISVEQRNISSDRRRRN